MLDENNNDCPFVGYARRVRDCSPWFLRCRSLLLVFLPSFDGKRLLLIRLSCTSIFGILRIHRLFRVRLRKAFVFRLLRTCISGAGILRLFRVWVLRTAAFRFQRRQGAWPAWTTVQVMTLLWSQFEERRLAIIGETSGIGRLTT
jgi:hypothetical protein